MSDEDSKMNNKIPDALRDFIMAIYKETFFTRYNILWC